MRLFYLLLCFLTLVGLVNGMPPISRNYNTHCHCPQVESRIIPPDSLRSIKLIPKGAHCQTTEIIAGLASGEKVCLNPQSAWVRKLVRFVMGRRQQQRGGALLR